MKIIRNVQGALEQAQPLIVNVDTVYVHTNIKKIERDTEGNPIENLYQYDEIQYSMSEYIQVIGSAMDILLGISESINFTDRTTMANQVRAGITTYSTNATNISDVQALTMPTLFAEWPNGVNSEGKYIKDQIIRHKGSLYRIAQEEVAPIESQKPDDEGMLAVYRPINPEHAGTLEDPIPWEYGMDCYKDKYYSYEEKIYKCTGDMIPCIWIPGTQGVYQWELVE